MRIVFDPAKDAANVAKHRVSLALAALLFDGPYLITMDRRFDYGEERCLAFGFIENRLFVCVYTDRAAERRIISLRKANQKEVKRYGDEIK